MEERLGTKIFLHAVLMFYEKFINKVLSHSKIRQAIYMQSFLYYMSSPTLGESKPYESFIYDFRKNEG